MDVNELIEILKCVNGETEVVGRYPEGCDYTVSPIDRKDIKLKDGKLVINVW